MVAWVAPPSVEPPRTIHIIDDDAQVGAALSDGLRAHGFRTLFSSDPEQSLTEARRALPDLILCDILMPRKNGHQLLQEFRADPVLRDRPFVFMTGNLAYAHPRKGMDLGADDFLLKPFSLAALVACVTARLQRAGLSRPGGPPGIRDFEDSLRPSLPREFLAPLTAVIGYAEALESIADRFSDGTAREYTRIIVDSGRRLRRSLVNHVATLSREAQSGGWQPAVLHSRLVADLISTGATMAARRRDREKDLVLELVGAPILGMPEDLLLTVEELTDTVLRLSSDHQEVRIRAVPTEHQLEITIGADAAANAPSQPQPWAPFGPFEPSGAEPFSSGLGLFMVQQTMQRLRGDWSYDTRQGRGTVSRLAFPIQRPRIHPG